MQYNNQQGSDEFAKSFLFANFIGDTLRYWQENFYHYADGWYRGISDEEMRMYLAKFLLVQNANMWLTKMPTISITSQLVSNIMLCVKSHTHLPEYIKAGQMITKNSDGTLGGIDAGRHIVFSNCMVMVLPKREPTVAEHSSKYFILNGLDYAYKPDRGCPMFEAFLDETFDGDKERIELIQQWFGYVMCSSDLSMHKFMMFVGEGANGKTVLSRILELLIGDENCSHIPLAMFSDKFVLSATIGKMLNSTSESSSELDRQSEMMLKMYTSGDSMEFQRKFRDSVRARPTAKILISTNELPRFADKSNGLWRRMIVVPFDKSVAEEKQNRNLIYLLMSERPGIFNWAHRGYQSLCENGGFNMPRRCSEMLSGYRSETNPARAFLESHYKYDAASEGIACSRVYDHYKSFCDADGYLPMNANNFGKEVKRLFPQCERVKKRINGREERFYSKIKTGY